MRVVVLGASGNFGGRIVRALQHNPSIEVIAAGRSGRPVAGAETVPSAIVDINSLALANQLRQLSAELVIHCVGPFQTQDYRVAEAALAVGSHYLDIADGREFVTKFEGQLGKRAIQANRTAITGASTLPALSSAVVQELGTGLAQIDSIDVVIAPGQRAVRGIATLEAVFSYLGKPFPVWRDHRWTSVWGWMDLRKVDLDVGPRLAAACDVPDLALFPSQFPEIRSVRFHAALEFKAQHLMLWLLAAARRKGLRIPVSRLAVGLDRWAGIFDSFAGDNGGMSVSVSGRSEDGTSIRRTWQLVAPASDGPEIPCMAAILLARRLALNSGPKPGAHACAGLLRLADFASEFSRWRIKTRVEEISE